MSWAESILAAIERKEKRQKRSKVETYRMIYRRKWRAKRKAEKLKLKEITRVAQSRTRQTPGESLPD